jgi:hypothetical protein
MGLLRFANATACGVGVPRSSRCCSAWSGSPRCRAFSRRWKTAVTPADLQPERDGEHGRRALRGSLPERASRAHVLASIAFFLAFAVIRTITHLIRAGRGPFHDVVTKGGHIHHLVGILLLLGVGYLWLSPGGNRERCRSPWTSQLTALLFGVASA